MSEEAPQPGPASQPTGVSVWAQYAQGRYESAERRLGDFRNWARQLAAATGVLIGLGTTIIFQIVKADQLEASRGWFLMSALVLAGAVVIQLRLLTRLIRLGYAGQEHVGPEDPVTLRPHVTDAGATEEMLGNYFAKGFSTLHKTAEDAAATLRKEAGSFVRSLWLMFSGIVITVFVAAGSMWMRRDMTEQTPSSTPSSPSSAPAASTPAAPAPTPAATPTQPAPSATPSQLVTPTPGLPSTHGASGPRETTALSTPTEGLRITEAKK